MHTDRRTRNRVRFIFWALLTLVCSAAVVLARGQERGSLERKSLASQNRAVHYANVFGARVDAERMSHPIFKSGYQELAAAVRNQILSDSRVARVRAWQTKGVLVFSSDQQSQEGVLKAPSDPGIVGAVKGQTVSIVGTEEFAADSQARAAPTELLKTYVPLRGLDGSVFGVVEIDQFYAALRDAASHPWFQVQVAFAAIAVLCLVMAGVSLMWARSDTAPETSFDVSAGAAHSDKPSRGVDDVKRRAREAEAEAKLLRGQLAELERSHETAMQSAAAVTAALPSTQPAAELDALRSRVEELEQELEEQQRGTPPGQLEALTARAAEAEQQVVLVEARALAAEQQASAMEQRAMAGERRALTAEDQVAAGNERLAGVEEELRDARSKLEEVELRAEEAEQRIGASEFALAEAEAARAKAVERALAEEESAKVAWDRANSAAAPVLSLGDEPTLPATVEERIAELEERLRRSEAERAMLRAGRPETVYEVRNRELQQELDDAVRRMREAEERSRTVQAKAAGVDQGVIAALEDRITSAERRAAEAERRMEERAGASEGNGDYSTNGDEPAQPLFEAAPDPEPVGPEPGVDASELRSKLSRATDRRKRIGDPTAKR